MKWQGRRPKIAAGAIGALAVLIGLVLLIVLPALATPPGVAIPPPSIPKGVTAVDVPTGGQSNDCTVFYANNPANQPAYQYRISNPKSQKYTTTVNGTTVTFTLTMNPPNLSPSLPAYANDKYVSFTSTGVAIADAGIKGGTDTARYNYTGLLGGPSYGAGVTSDGYLHGPAQSTVSTTNLTPTSLYSVSNLTFCFTLAGSVSGTVYQDANQNGTKDTGDTGQSGWTVSLYKGVTAGNPVPAGTLVSTTTSGSDGSYNFSLPFTAGTTYRVCESPPSGEWAQSQPLPSSPDICTTGTEKPKGYDFTPTSATQSFTGKDFGNVSAIACVQGPFGLPNYTIQLDQCKENTFVFSATPGVIDGNPSTPPPSVSVWVGDSTQAEVPLVEKIVFPFTVQPPGTPQPLMTLFYDDTFPFSQADATPMPFCQQDPRDTTEFGLQPGLDPATVLPGTATSCLIQQTMSAVRPDAVNHPDQGTYTAYVYSRLDGYRGVSP